MNDYKISSMIENVIPLMVKCRFNSGRNCLSFMHSKDILLIACYLYEKYNRVPESVESAYENILEVYVYLGGSADIYNEILDAATSERVMNYKIIKFRDSCVKFPYISYHGYERVNSLIGPI